MYKLYIYIPTRVCLHAIFSLNARRERGNNKKEETRLPPVKGDYRARSPTNTRGTGGFFPNLPSPRRSTPRRRLKSRADVFRNRIRNACFWKIIRVFWTTRKTGLPRLCFVHEHPNTKDRFSRGDQAFEKQWFLKKYLLKHYSRSDCYRTRWMTVPLKKIY